MMHSTDIRKQGNENDESPMIRESIRVYLAFLRLSLVIFYRIRSKEMQSKDESDKKNFEYEKR